MIINTKYGSIEGYTSNGITTFKGVPYAKPPIGELRFKKPQKLSAWEGVYKADSFRFRSMQGPTRPGFYYKEFYSNPEFTTEMSEDCLYLNLWIPELNPEVKLPVALYVHGGAFLGGAGSNLPFVCDELAKSGVIIITINYRLGAFGFLCHPLLGIEGENIAGGNYGLWDQLEAMRWVKENIEAFGGDAQNITVFGQSAGAMSLQTLAVTEQAEGLFEKMILQSGGGYKNPLAEYRTIEKASEYAEDLLTELGIPDQSWRLSDAKKQEAIDLLHTASSEVMIQAIGKAMGKAFEQKKGMPYVPVVDGELLTMDGNQLMEEGKYLKINYMLGSNGNDLTTEGNSKIEPSTNLMLQADISFAKMINGNTTHSAYVYYFDRKLPGDESGAFHSAELWYVFGSLDYCWRPLEKADYELSRKMISWWSNFMKTGNPNVGSESEWPVCSEEDPFYKVIDVEQ